MQINSKYPNEFKDQNGEQLVADRSCSNYQLNNLTISMGGLDYRISQVYYARTQKVGLSKTCNLLVKPNFRNKYDARDDPTHSNVFLLGLPFMRAF